MQQIDNTQTTPQENNQASSNIPPTGENKSIIQDTKSKKAVIIILGAILAIVIIIVVALALNKTKNKITEQNGTQQDQTESLPVQVKRSYYLGSIIDIADKSIKLEVLPADNLGLSSKKNITVQVNQQTIFVQRKQPANILKGSDPAKLFKQTNITFKDLKIGDKIIAASAGEDIFQQEEFTAKSVLLIKITG